MKKTIVMLALVSAFGGAWAQTADSNAGSASQSGAISGSQSGVAASNSGNVTATGNQNASRSDSASQSGAQSGSLSGAVGNNVTFNSPETVKSVNSTTVNGTSNEHLTSDGTQRVITSGGVNNTDTVRYEYSGTQTVKNVPSIAMSGPASGPCTGVSGGVGVSGPGWGVGFNGSAVMDDCRMRENTRVLGMGMQSLDGAANPQEKGEATVMFMDAMRGLAAYNAQIVDGAVKKAK